jgi:DUF4097 and DUF4098 domain-containing protein YvlB
MSWLYSIVIAGQVFSSNSDTTTSNSVQPPAPEKVTVVQGDEREKFEQSYPLSGNGRVSVSNVNGSIVMEAWERNEVKLEAVKIADTKEALSYVEIRVDSQANSFSVEADYDNFNRTRGDRGWKNHGNLQVQFKLTVPRGAVLDEIETVNGSVTASNFVGVTKISAVNGNVNASNLRGTANLSTVNGEVVADFDRLESGSKISLNTVNGKVSLVIPSDSNATVKADSLNGDIRTDFGLPVRKGKYVGRDLYGRIGNGDVQIKLESVNGPLSVLRKNDNKPLSPATNLLPQKAKDDEDWDNDTSWQPKVKKVDKDIARAVRDSTRAATDGARIAQEEMVRIAPEIEKIKVESLPKVKIDQEQLQKQIQENIEKQKDSLVRLRSINWAGGVSYIEKKSNSFAVKGIPKVTVEAKGCSVRVKGWDRPEVKYVLTEVETRRGRNAVSVNENYNDSNVTLKVSGNERASRDMFFNGDSDSVRIEVFVPRKANLKIVSNGEIRMEGVSGDVDLTGVDEAIDVRNTDGKLRITAADALVRVIGFKGDVDARTVDGDVYLEGNFTSISGSTGDGSFIVTIPANHNADVTSNVEAITVEDLPVPEAVKEGQWRFGAGGPKYTFKVTDGEVRFRNANTLTNSQ